MKMSEEAKETNKKFEETMRIYEETRSELATIVSRFCSYLIFIINIFYLFLHSQTLEKNLKCKFDILAST